MRSALLAAFVCCSIFSTCLADTKEASKPAPAASAHISYAGEALIVQQWNISFYYGKVGELPRREQLQHSRHLHRAYFTSNRHYADVLEADESLMDDQIVPYVEVHAANVF